MNILILKPGQRRIEYACLLDGNKEPVLAGSTANLREGQDDATALEAALLQVRRDFRLATGAEPEAIGVCTAFWGAAFAGPAVLDSEVSARLRAILSQAPLHIPFLLQVLNLSPKVFRGAAVVILFETAFFAQMPLREQLFALEPDLCVSLELRRFGYHGLFHEAACEQAAQRRLERKVQEPARIISICLEPRPEVAAVIGRRPVMVTSGATPLEGLPGETSSGDVDPSLVLILAEKQKWGPERINLLLTQESGLLGLVGQPTTFDELFSQQGPAYQRARSLIQYRILQSCGAGMATLGGLDAIIFSGRYAALGETLGPWLSSRLRLEDRIWGCCLRSLPNIAAEKTALALLTAQPATIA